MSSFWNDNYFGNRYSNDTWGANAANEEEVVSGVSVDKKTQLPDLNKTPTPPVDEPNYPAHQVYPDYGYGYESPYVQPSGYGAENAPVDEPYYPTQQSYPGYGVYGDEGGYGSYSGYDGEVDTGVKLDTVDMIDPGVKVDTVDTEATVDTKNMVDMVMTPVTHHFMNHLPRAIRFK
ncbi:hypothetical protein Hanom_Chr08g00701661 [Helianthus anomalus]